MRRQLPFQGGSRTTVRLPRMMGTELYFRRTRRGRTMRYAEAGFDLEIDLSRGSIEKVATEPDLPEYYLGGQGVGAKILFERVPPETHPFSEDNLLIFGTGLLHAPPAPAANRTVVN